MTPPRAVDLDAIAIAPAPEIVALSGAIADAAVERGFKRLESIDAILLDTLMEWHVDGERCIAISGAGLSARTNPADSVRAGTEARTTYRIVYDTHFSHAALADAIARALPEQLVMQFNLQEQVDFTLRILRGERTLYEYSNAPSFFNWGRCIGHAEPAQLARPETAALAAAIGHPEKEAALQDLFQTISAKVPGESAGTRGRKKGGVYDAVQALAGHAGLPRLYRFFEGWMKSSLDWDEDDVETVLAFRAEAKA